MTDTDAPDNMPSAEDAVGILNDLHLALAGKNGYGGNVAEIYAYRLLPPGAPGGRMSHQIPGPGETKAAARNLTWLAQQFIAMHDRTDDTHIVHIGIESGYREFRDVDLDIEPIEPFGHRVHLRVSSTPKQGAHVNYSAMASYHEEQRARDEARLARLRSHVEDPIGLETLVFATRRGRSTMVIAARDAPLFRHSQTHPNLAPKSVAPIVCAICGECGPENVPCPGCGAL